jgi:hypothetical protein
MSSFADVLMIVPVGSGIKRVLSDRSMFARIIEREDT